MQSVAMTAACAAKTRADMCRRRAEELSHHQHVKRADVARARAALDVAKQRAADAKERLQQRQARCRHQGEAPAGRGPVPGKKLIAPVECPEPAELRRQAREIPLAELYVAYISVGGHCDAFEVDGFVHSLTELPKDELTVLGQAVWELTEF